jgi:hypothetical protein
MSSPTDLLPDLGVIYVPESKKSHLRVIKTARTERAINEAVNEGFYPLVKRLEPSAEIRSKFAVFQEKQTGKIKVVGDLRVDLEEFGDGDYERVIGFHFYYPHHFESPFAAYLIPKDIRMGERVLLEDLIEDYVGGRWNQGDVFRLDKCEAIWNGKELELQIPFDNGEPDMIG